MKMYFDYETKSLLSSLLDHLCPTTPVALDELQIFDASTQHHVRQIERMHTDWPAQDESEVGHAIPMLAILDTPGKYTANGTEVLLLGADPDGTLKS